MEIDRNSPVPYYYQLQEILKQEIERGRWAPGDLLPSEADLADALGISRTVIRKALDVLEADGQAHRVKGKGTIVSPAKYRYEAITAAQRWHDEDLGGQSVLSRLIHMTSVPVGRQIGRLLGLAQAVHVYEVVFVQSVQDQPVSLAQMYLRQDASAQLRQLAARNELPAFDVPGPDALVQLAQRYRVQVEQSQVTVEASLANEFEAEMLGVKRQRPMFLLSTLTSARDGRQLSFTRTVVRSDHFRFSVAIKHGLDAGMPSSPAGVTLVTHR
jgi:GntR family transcriptional regulator